MNKINDQVQAVYNLTPLQQGMLYQKILDEHSPVNVLQYTLKIRGIMDEERVRTALRLVSAGHDALRTLILYREVEKPRQVVLRERQPELCTTDLRQEPADMREACFQRLLQKDLARGFDLEHDTLLRLTLVRTGEEESAIIWTMHHIIVDGWCFMTLSNDFATACNDLAAGRTPEDLLEKIRLHHRRQVSYGDYVRWVETRDRSAAMVWWKDLLAGCSESAIPMPLNTPSVDAGEEPGAASALVPVETEERIKALASELNITVNSILEAAWGIALQRCAHTRDAVFGKAVSGRDAEMEGLESLVGLFVNTIPVRITTDDDDTVTDLLRRTHEQALASARHSHCALAEIQALSALGGALIQVLFVYENHIRLDQEKPALPGMDVLAWTASENTGYPLALKAWHDERLHLDIIYSGIYSAKEMELLAARLLSLLDQISHAANPVAGTPRRVAELDFLAAGERGQILDVFNDTVVPWPEDLTFSQLFETRAGAPRPKQRLPFMINSSPSQL